MGSTPQLPILPTQWVHFKITYSFPPTRNGTKFDSRHSPHTILFFYLSVYIYLPDPDEGVEELGVDGLDVLHGQLLVQHPVVGQQHINLNRSGKSSGSGSDQKIA